MQDSISNFHFTALAISSPWPLTIAYSGPLRTTTAAACDEGTGYKSNITHFLGTEEIITF